MGTIQQERGLLVLAACVLWSGLLAVDLAHGKVSVNTLLIATGLIFS